MARSTSRAIDARSLTVAAPALFMTFIYCECMRYVLIVRWYRRLERAHAARASQPRGRNPGSRNRPPHRLAAR